MYVDYLFVRVNLNVGPAPRVWRGKGDQTLFQNTNFYKLLYTFWRPKGTRFQDWPKLPTTATDLVASANG